MVLFSGAPNSEGYIEEGDERKTIVVTSPLQKLCFINFCYLLNGGQLSIQFSSRGLSLGPARYFIICNKQCTGGRQESSSVRPDHDRMEEKKSTRLFSCLLLVWQTDSTESSDADEKLPSNGTWWKMPIGTTLYKKKRIRLLQFGHSEIRENLHSCQNSTKQTCFPSKSK